MAKQSARVDRIEAVAPLSEPPVVCGRLSSESRPPSRPGPPKVCRKPCGRSALHIRDSCSALHGKSDCKTCIVLPSLDTPQAADLRHGFRGVERDPSNRWTIL